MKRIALVLATLALAGCPGNWGFRVQVYTRKDPATTLQVADIAPSTNLISSTDLVTIPGANVTCDGCGEHPITVDPDGVFGVSQGTSYGSPRPVTLHITAPGYVPVDLELPHPPAVSQAGAASVTVVMKKIAITN